jgi:site-specific recombinase XerC
MGRRGVSGAPGGHHRRRHRKAPPGLQIKERDGHWHAVGTVRVKGRSVRIRRSTGLEARPELWDDACEVRRQIEEDVRNEVIHGVKPSVPTAIAAHKYLSAPRRRPLGATTVGHVQRITAAFGKRLLSSVTESEWAAFVDRETAGRKAETRERFLNSVVGLLHWCQKKPRQWIAELPAFDRDKDARNPRTRGRRRVAELTPEILQVMLDHAWPGLAAQIAVEVSTGARVASVLNGCRLCDLILAEGREQITFHDTKNGESVTAALHPWAAEYVRRYLEVRGNLRDREAPLFLTQRGKPYTTKGRGGQNKTAFNAMKRRAIKALLRDAVRARRAGDLDRATKLRGDARLVRQVTQHWFRHHLATTMLAMGADIRAVMEQGGWLDPRSVLGYAHDVPEHRRQLVRNLPLGGTSLTRDPATTTQAVERKG